MLITIGVETLLFYKQLKNSAVAGILHTCAKPGCRERSNHKSQIDNSMPNFGTSTQRRQNFLNRLFKNSNISTHFHLRDWERNEIGKL